jgi:hypothetical protein
MHGVRGFSRFAQIDGLITGHPGVYARLPKIDTDESRTQGAATAFNLLKVHRAGQVA